MKKSLFIAALLLGLTSISFAQSSSLHEEKNIEISLEVLEKKLDAIGWDKYSEKIEIKIEKITDEIHTKILESQTH